MKHSNGLHRNRKKALLLGVAIAMGSVTGAAAGDVQQASAAQVQQPSAIYAQFQKQLKKPGNLIQARNYLINHINQVSVWNATVMTLQLENAQLADIGDYSEKIYPEHIQMAVEKASVKGGLTYTNLLNNLPDAKVRALLIEGRDKGYKMESSEGLYYPVMHYEAFKRFKSFVSQEVAAYIDIMAAESNHPTAFDAGIVIPWEELIKRTLAMESFIRQYPNSNRGAVIREEFKYARHQVFYGLDNTPAYGYESDDTPSTLDPELRQAYEAAIVNGVGNSEVLAQIKKLLTLLESTDYTYTAEIDRYLEPFQLN
ncbi:hypothetical protein GCM10010912_11960 [Paenibacillus albidus]|uniref:Uncharacterized protein n=1 Tax=Paenibacillus albidus TaxID=2041023 RepID=A0A917C354_9BACL|nr:hypothetical protein [Paenibacillus albidus]GGF68529.1 hypothetical protein GCM10010912_11960 [Paenibacillus albidus]